MWVGVDRYTVIHDELLPEHSLLYCFISATCDLPSLRQEHQHKAEADNLPLGKVILVVVIVSVDVALLIILAFLCRGICYKDNETAKSL